MGRGPAARVRALIGGLAAALAFAAAGLPRAAAGEEVQVPYYVEPDPAPAPARAAAPGRAYVSVVPVSGAALPERFAVAVAGESGIRRGPDATDFPVATTIGTVMLAFYVGGGSSVQHRYLWLAPGEEREVTVALGAAAPGVRGRAVGRDGKPLAGARVWLEAVEERAGAAGSAAGDAIAGLSRGLVRQDAEAGDDGRFALPWVPSAAATISLSQDREARRFGIWRGSVAGGGAEEIEIRDETAWIEGTVYRAGGAPVAGAWVAAHPARGPDDPATLGAAWFGLPFYGATLKEDGRFRIAVHGGRRYAVRVWLADRTLAEGRAEAAPGPGKTARVRPLRAGGATAMGTVAVALPAGFFDPRWPVFVEFLDPGGCTYAWTSCLADGDAASEVPAGGCSIRLSQPGRPARRLDGIKVEPGQRVRVRPRLL